VTDLEHDRTERTEEPDPSEKAEARPALLLSLECARPTAGAVRYELGDVHEVILGRGAERTERRSARGKRATLELSIPDRRMSTRHARIVRRGARLFLEDFGSTNGTLVNGRRVDRSPLLEGDVLELGHTLFMIASSESAAARARAAAPAGDGAAIPGLSTLDPALATRLSRLTRVASATVPIILRGETGTGKELLARAVHALSGRPGPVVAVNCGAIPDGLVESHLFGHRKGAFSGAVRDEPGAVRAADMGTLFLDEIGDLPLGAQTALLRVLQEGEVVPVGQTAAVSVDVRVVSATHRPLESLVEHGSFRRDLYARLAGFVHQVPPLRERRADIGALIADLLASPKVPGGAALRFRPDAGRALLRYDWPLNVRELVQCLASAAAQAEEGLVKLQDLPPLIAAAAKTAEPDTEADEELRRELLRRLVESKGNVSDMARSMGKARQQIQRWLRRFGLEPERYREGG